MTVRRARSLESIWSSLVPAGEAPGLRSILGYRGCWLRDPEGRLWLAHDGIVVLEEDRNGVRRREGRRDGPRDFERALLATAPAGLLPLDLVPFSLKP